MLHLFSPTFQVFSVIQFVDPRGLKSAVCLCTPYCNIILIAAVLRMWHLTGFCLVCLGLFNWV